MLFYFIPLGYIDFVLYLVDIMHAKELDFS